MTVTLKTPDGVTRDLSFKRENDNIEVNISQLILGFMPYNYDMSFDILLQTSNYCLIVNDAKSRVFLVSIGDLDQLDIDLIRKTKIKYNIDNLKTEEICIKV